MRAMVIPNSDPVLYYNNMWMREDWVRNQERVFMIIKFNKIDNYLSFCK